MKECVKVSFAEIKQQLPLKYYIIVMDVPIGKIYNTMLSNRQWRLRVSESIPILGDLHCTNTSENGETLGIIFILYTRLPISTHVIAVPAPAENLRHMWSHQYPESDAS